MTALICQICYQSAGERAIELCYSCGEDFHRDCIEKAIINVGGENKCPMCRDQFYRIRPEFPQVIKKETKVHVDLSEYELGADDERAGRVMAGAMLYLVGLIGVGIVFGFWTGFILFALSAYGYLAYSAFIKRDLRHRRL